MPRFSAAATVGVNSGLPAAAIFDVDGKPIAVAGALDDDEVRAITMLLTRRFQAPELLARMLDGEMLASALNEREVRIGIAARCVFVAAIVDDDSKRSRTLVHGFHSDVEREVSRARADFTAAPRASPSGSGGSSSGPAELPLIEIGITVRRDRN